MRTSGGDSSNAPKKASHWWRAADQRRLEMSCVSPGYLQSELGIRQLTSHDALLTVLEATLLTDWFGALGPFPPPSSTFAAAPATATTPAFAALAAAGRHNFNRAQKPVSA